MVCGNPTRRSRHRRPRGPHVLSRDDHIEGKVRCVVLHEGQLTPLRVKLEAGGLPLTKDRAGRGVEAVEDKACGALSVRGPTALLAEDEAQGLVRGEPQVLGADAQLLDVAEAVEEEEVGVSGLVDDDEYDDDDPASSPWTMDVSPVTVEYVVDMMASVRAAKAELLTNT